MGVLRNHCNRDCRSHQDHHLLLARGEGALAIAILLDQFPRNAFRGTPHMYGTDRLARLLVGRALDAGVDRDIEPDLRVFLHLPFSHSEDLGDQERGFPHRNALLGRESTAEERAFLEGGGFGG